MTQKTLTLPAKPDCANCPWADPVTKAPRHQPVLGVVPSNHKHIRGCIIGEGPGHEEVEQGTPFVGRTGQWLDDRLGENGLNRHEHVIINAQACIPPKGEKNDNTMRAATKACSPLFNSQYADYSQLPTLAMGKWAGAAANKGTPITVDTGRGFIRGNLLVTWHPTYAAFYNPWKAGEFVNDLQRFRRMLDGRLEKDPTIVIHPTLDEVVRLHRLHKELACDIETKAKPGRPDHEGKDPYRAAVRTIAFGTTDYALAYWWGSDMKIQQAIINILQDPAVVKIFHNGWMFDQPTLLRHGVRVQNARDTRDMRRAISATSRLSLRYLTSLETDFIPWKEPEDEK